MLVNTIEAVKLPAAPPAPAAIDPAMFEVAHLAAAAADPDGGSSVGAAVGGAAGGGGGVAVELAVGLGVAVGPPGSAPCALQPARSRIPSTTIDAERIVERVMIPPVCRAL
ncbi:hypothetical protein GCM10027413_24830 [Conyzicola nivalis]|uniref:Uncharacterized protein n=1 Tax=Conyzicola nivalis TaxID=1477021 RepID=A0A916WEE0_9MICO|nr:hypothetical protein GCM10010979_01790 [Conyzicola nivalis]